MEQSQSNESEIISMLRESDRKFKIVWWKHYLANNEVNYRINSNPLYATSIFPGLHYTDIDKDGKIGLMKAVDFLQSAEIFLENYPERYTQGDKHAFLDLDMALEGRTIFVAASEYTFSRAWYNNSIPKWSFVAKESFCGLGNTSLLLIVDLFLPNSSEPIISRINKLISVDRITRKPVAFPDWYKKKMHGREVVKLGEFKVEGFSKPACTFVRRVQIVWSDTDSNNHATFSSYIRFGQDTLLLAVHKAQKPNTPQNLSTAVTPESLEPARRTPSQKQTGGVMVDSHHQNPSPLFITSDILNNGVKHLKICFIKECLEGDFIDVHLWQEKGEELQVRCSIENLEGAPICQFTLEYYGALSKL